MATTSAVIHIGTYHPNDSGMSHGFKTIKYVEGARLAWICNNDHEVYAFDIPNLSLELGLVLAYKEGGASIDEKIRNEIDKFLRNAAPKRFGKNIEIDMTEENINIILRISQTIKNIENRKFKMLICAFSESHLLRLVDNFKPVEFNLEVLTTKYKREYSSWGQSFYEKNY